MNLSDLTPVENHNGIWVKRDDLFEVCGVRGGKARSAYQLIQQYVSKGYTKFATAGSKDSPQCEIVSCICEELGLDCYLFMNGVNLDKPTSVIETIQRNSHSTLMLDSNWKYSNVIIYHCKQYCAEHPDTIYIPFGLECAENVAVTSMQVQNIPTKVNRIIIPVGSGMMFSSVAYGLAKYKIDIPILGVQVGKDPRKTIQKYYPMFKFSRHKLIEAESPYNVYEDAWIDDIQLDPVYEAKCIDFVDYGDLLWIVGKRLIENNNS